jgi:DNA-binding transcriptional LysR family regulator
MGKGIRRIERRVKLHDLRVLMSVVERGSMAKAAESLATSQPAISRSIADLEFSLGVRLLDRGPGGVAPTPYGRALIRRGIAIFDELKQGVQDIEFLADPTVGEVRIAAPIGWGAGFVATVIDRLARRYPRVVCHLTISDTTALLLEQRQVDLVVTRPFAIPPPEDHFQGELLFTDSTFVIAGIKNPWARRHRIKLADLINEPWALPPPDDQAHSLLTDVFRANRSRGEWTGWHHHIEEPHIDACGATFHRLRARGGKANGNAPTPAGSKSLNLSGTPHWYSTE